MNGLLIPIEVQNLLKNGVEEEHHIDTIRKLELRMMSMIMRVKSIECEENKILSLKDTGREIIKRMNSEKENTQVGDHKGKMIMYKEKTDIELTTQTIRMNEITEKVNPPNIKGKMEKIIVAKKIKDIGQFLLEQLYN